MSTEQVNFSDILAASRWADELVKISADSSYIFDVSASNINSITYTATTITTSATPVIAWDLGLGKDKYIEILSGAGQGQIRKISGNDVTGTITVALAMSPVPAANDSFVIHQFMHKRFEFHGTIDRFMRVVDVFKDLLFTARSHPAGVGKTYTVITDRDKPVSGILNMSNTIAESFSESMPFERPTHFRADFSDQDNEFETSTFELVDYYSANNQGGYQMGDKRTETSFQMWGVSTLARAVGLLTYLKDKARHCSRTASCSMMLDNITMLPGDVVRLQNDRPGWGDGARATAVGSNYIDIPDSVELFNGHSYLLKMRIANVDTEYEVDEATSITHAAGGDIARLYITGTWITVPTVYEDLWVLEDETDGVAGKLFTVESVRRKNNNSGTVQLLEYNESVYDDLPVVPTKVVSSVPRVLPPAPELISLKLIWKKSISNIWEAYVSAALKFRNYQSIGKNSFDILLHTEDGDTTATIMAPKNYEYKYGISDRSFEVPAQQFNEQTIYVSAAAVSPAGLTGAHCPPARKYITTSPAKIIAAMQGTDITGATMYYTLQPGLALLRDIAWGYDLSVRISGFCVMMRYQKYRWGWTLNGAWSDTATTCPPIDTTSLGGASAWADLKAAMTGFKSTLEPAWAYCYFHVDNGTAHEIIRVDLAASVIEGAWVIDRAQEGTTAISFSAGAVFEWVCSPATDAKSFLDDPDQRAYSWDTDMPVKQCFYAAIAPYLKLADGGWDRGNISLWAAQEKK
ncbi:MAG: hypothetical protein JEZ12_23585 [Desulfobacterium sp.]|nr:hypothetical protein [Desulfobacterium sp.]